MGLIGWLAVCFLFLLVVVGHKTGNVREASAREQLQSRTRADDSVESGSNSESGRIRKWSSRTPPQKQRYM